MRQFQKASQLDSGGLAGYIDLLMQGGIDTLNVAISKYERSAKIYPEDTWNYIILGQLHEAIGRLKNNSPVHLLKAQKYYTTALQYAKDQPYAITLIVYRYEQLRKFGDEYVDGNSIDQATSMLATISKTTQSGQVLDDVGKTYQMLGKTKEALDVYKIWGEVDPNNPAISSRILETYADIYSKVYLRQDQYDQIVKIYQGIPDPDGDLRTSIGRLYLNAKQYQLAETTFKNIIAEFPTYNQGYSWLGRVYEQQTMWKEAISTYELGLTNTLDDELFFQSLGVLYEKLGSDYLQSTIQLYNKAIERSPYNRFFYLHLFDVFLENRRFPEARELYQTSLKNIPSDYQLHLDIAKLAVGIDDELATQAYSTAIELSPKDDFAYQQLIPIYKQNGDLEKLAELYKKGIEYQPDQQKFYTLHLAELYYSQKLYDDALVFYLKLLENKDASLEQFIIVEGIYTDKKMFDEAATIVQDGLKRFPDSDQLNFISGQLMDKQDRPKEAFEAYQKAIKLNPLVDERAYKRIGELLIKQKDPESALKVYEQGLDSFPDSYGLTINLGDVFLLMNKESEGENAYKKALEIQPVSGVAYLRLGKLYEKQKRIDEAILIYQEGLKNVKQKASRQNIQKQLDKLLSADTTP